jgi:serine/threonine protein kinase
LEHRDVKPESIYFTESGTIFLNDWASSRFFENNTRSIIWVGTIGFSEPPTSDVTPSVADLRALVRTAWTLLFKTYPPQDDFEQTVVKPEGPAECATAKMKARGMAIDAAAKYWSPLLASGMWKEAMDLASASKYDDLGKLFTSMCPS